MQLLSLEEKQGTRSPQAARAFSVYPLGKAFKRNSFYMKNDGDFSEPPIFKFGLGAMESQQEKLKIRLGAMWPIH